MTVRPRYTLRRKLHHLTRLAHITATTIHPHLTLAAHTARIITTRHWIDQPPTQTTDTPTPTPTLLPGAPTLNTTSLHHPRQDP